MVEYIESMSEILVDKYPVLLRRMLLTAFNYALPGDAVDKIDLVYPKQRKNKEEIERLIEKWLLTKVRDYKQNNELSNQMSIESMFENMAMELGEGADGVDGG